METGVNGQLGRRARERAEVQYENRNGFATTQSNDSDSSLGTVSSVDHTCLDVDRKTVGSTVLDNPLEFGRAKTTQ